LNYTFNKRKAVIEMITALYIGLLPFAQKDIFLSL